MQEICVDKIKKYFVKKVIKNIPLFELDLSYKEAE